MKPEHARHTLSLPEHQRRVLHHPAGGPPQDGVIVSVGDPWVYVRFADGSPGRAVNPADLTLLTDPAATKETP